MFKPLPPTHHPPLHPQTGSTNASAEAKQASGREQREEEKKKSMFNGVDAVAVERDQTDRDDCATT